MPWFSESHSPTNSVFSDTQATTVKSICCLGAGYVGGPTCAVIAMHCPDIKVTIVDLNADRIAAWNSPDLPIFEPGLLEVVEKCRGQNLFFTTDVDAAIDGADLIFISVNTPTKTTGIGAGYAADINWVEAATRRIAAASNSDKIVVEKSTVPCRTADHMRAVLIANGKPGVRFEILSNPEFLAEGTAIRDLITPDRVLIGSLETSAGYSALQSLASVYANWVPADRIITINLWSSELAKLAANALLAQRISSVNALSVVCEAVGANIQEVAGACGLDSRIGDKFLKPSVGFGGSCFQKDILNLVYLSESLFLPEVAAYWRSIVELNNYSKRRFSKRVIDTMYHTITNKKIALLGFAYKKDTGDTRESPAIELAEHFCADRAKVHIYDPQVKESQIWSDLSASMPNSTLESLQKQITISGSAMEACSGSEAIVIATEWPEFAKLDWQKIYDSMSKPAFIFDGRLILNRQKLINIGFHVESIGISNRM